MPGSNDYPEKTCSIDRLVRNKRLVDAALDGRKTEQRRDGVYGYPGETFELAGQSFEMTGLTHERLGELFARDVRTIEIESRTFNFRFRSPEHWIGLWREVYGPLHKAFDALDESGQAALTAAVTDVIGQHNVATDGTVVAPAEYLEVVVTRR